MYKVVKTIQLIIEKSSFLSILFLALMTLLTFFDVFLRYFFRRPIIGSTEMTEMIMVGVVFFAVAWCASRGEHVSVDIIESKLSKKGMRITDSCNFILTALAGLLIATQSVSQAKFLKDMGIASQILNIPRYPFLLVTAFGFALMFLDALVQLYNINTKLIIKTELLPSVKKKEEQTLKLVDN